MSWELYSRDNGGRLFVNHLSILVLHVISDKVKYFVLFFLNLSWLYFWIFYLCFFWYRLNTYAMFLLGFVMVIFDSLFVFLLCLISNIILSALLGFMLWVQMILEHHIATLWNFIEIIIKILYLFYVLMSSKMLSLAYDNWYHL